MTSENYVVVVVLRRPTEWQQSSEAAYGPLTKEQALRFAKSLRAVTSDGDCPVMRIVCYPLNDVKDGPE